MYTLMEQTFTLKDLLSQGMILSRPGCLHYSRSEAGEEHSVLRTQGRAAEESGQRIFSRSVISLLKLSGGQRCRTEEKRRCGGHG